MSKLSDLRAIAEKAMRAPSQFDVELSWRTDAPDLSIADDVAQHMTTFNPATVLALIAICDAARRMRQSTTMGAEREARDDLDVALKALEAA